MPDFAMCKSEDCSLKTECKRYTSTPKKIGHQNYFLPDERGEDCGYFMPEQKEEETSDAPQIA